MKKTILIAIFIAGCGLAPALTASAATNYSLMLDWSANTYAPFLYQAKAKTMPINGSTITAYATLFTVSAKQGVFAHQQVNPASYAFSWYVNDKKLSSGAGLDTFNYTVPRGIAMDEIAIRLDVFNKDTLIASKRISIPLENTPQVRIVQEVNGKVIPLSVERATGNQGSTLKLVPLPYFFNVNNPLQLSFLWYEGRTRLPSTAYTGGAFEITLPNYAARDTFKSIIYNTGFDLELGQQRIDIISR